MKKVLKFMCFWILFFVILGSLTFVFRPKNNTEDAGMYKADRMGYLAEPENTIDVVFMGNSLLFTSIAPTRLYEEHGFTSYDCSMSAMKIDRIYYMLLEVLEKQNPKIVVLEPETLLYRYSFANVVSYFHDKMFLSVKYHDRWKDLTLDDLSLNVNYTQKDVDKGFYRIAKIDGVKNYNKKYMEMHRMDSDITFIASTYLDLIKKACDERGIKLMFMSVPVLSYTYERHDAIAKLAEEKGIDYIDLNFKNDEIQIDYSKDTKDRGRHLNYTGAYKVTTYMGNYLESLNILEDHRGDEKYAFWDEDIKAYKEKYGEDGTDSSKTDKE